MNQFYPCASIRTNERNRQRGIPVAAAILATVLLALVLPSLASALSLRIDYTASVTTFTDPGGLLPGTLNGDSVTGFIMFEIDPIPLDQDPSLFAGEWTITGSFDLNLPLYNPFGGVTTTVKTDIITPSIEIEGDVDFGLAGIYEAIAMLGSSTAPAGELFLFTDADARDSFNTGFLELKAPTDPSFYLLAEFTDIQFSEVPEPSTATLLGLGLASLAVAAKRKRVA